MKEDRKMTSRERVLAAANHKPVDMMPIDFGACGASGINVLAYNQLKKHLGLDLGPTKIYDVNQQLALPDIEVIDRFGGDALELTQGFEVNGVVNENWQNWELKDGSTCLVPVTFNPVMNEKGEWELKDGNLTLSRMPADGWYFDQVHIRYKDITSIEELDKIVMPSISDAQISFLKAKAKSMFETTDKAISFAFSGSILERSFHCFGHERFFMDLATDPEFVHAWHKKLSENHLSNLKRVIDAIGEYIQIIIFGDDLGTQNAPLISPNMYREMIKPYHKLQYRYVRDNYPDIKVFLHSCGAIFDLIPDLIDAGVEILNPVQISCVGMEAQKLKREFGKDLTFWGGGANMQHTVVYDSLKGIKDEVRHLIEVFHKDSGYIFNQVHNIQANISPEKIIAIYDTALAFRKEH